ncbi:arsenate reductase ArsC [Asticcacaulis sp.]|uniref:arsenate reductase ArsC n=1 Tax=Asticcacaulis sp. TaxID=1872648 RepID=UPI002BE11978|nr:arsenate reductase ArsC [Asticcacaulis sp.]HTM80784.1 arsenate reductase ArsC [Asticcacaulis sp.]
MTDKIYNVLFICTGNSARSILAEAILNQIGNGRFNGYSAGSMPRGEVNPNTLNFLSGLGIPTDFARSKSWDEFAGAGAPALDFIITVCDNAAGEVCPIWPGQPMTAHWGLPDPAAATGTDAEIALAFADAYRVLRNRIAAFINLPIKSLDKLSLQTKLSDIGKDAL